MRIDVGCEDVEFPAVESRVIDCYDFLRDVTVDAREVEPDRLTRGRYVPFFKAKDNVQSSDSAFLTVYIDRVVVVNPSWLTVSGTAGGGGGNGGKAGGVGGEVKGAH